MKRDEEQDTRRVTRAYCIGLYGAVLLLLGELFGFCARLAPCRGDNRGSKQGTHQRHSSSSWARPCLWNWQGSDARPSLPRRRQSARARGTATAAGGWCRCVADSRRQRQGRAGAGVGCACPRAGALGCSWCQRRGIGPGRLSARGRGAGGEGPGMTHPHEVEDALAGDCNGHDAQ